MTATLAVLLSISAHRVNATRCCDTVLADVPGNYTQYDDDATQRAAAAAACNSTALCEYFCASTLVFDATSNSSELRRHCGAPKDWPAPALGAGTHSEVIELAGDGGTTWCKQEQFRRTTNGKRMLFAYRCRCTGHMCNEADVARMLAERGRGEDNDRGDTQPTTTTEITTKVTMTTMTTEAAETEMTTEEPLYNHTKMIEAGTGNERENASSAVTTGSGTVVLMCCNDTEPMEFGTMLTATGACYSRVTCKHDCLLTVTGDGAAWRQCGSAAPPVGRTKPVANRDGGALVCGWRPAGDALPSRVVCDCDQSSMCNDVGDLLHSDDIGRLFPGSALGTSTTEQPQPTTTLLDGTTTRHPPTVACFVAVLAALFYATH